MRSLRVLRNEDGIALIMALGVMFALTISALAVIQYTSANSRSASYARSNQQATALAEAGTNFARSILWQASNPVTLAPFSGTTSVDGRSVAYSGTFDALSKTWTLNGTVTMPSPTGGSSITRRVTTQVEVETTLAADSNTLKVWGRLFANNPNGCINLKNDNVVQRSVYSRGGLCLKNNDRVNAADVQVEKGLTFGNNTNLTAEKLQVGGGCGKDASGKPIKCSNSGSLNAKESDVKPEGLTKPSLDLSGWYAKASPGPLNNCTVGSFPGGFDNDTIPNGSRGTVSVAPSSSYTCKTATGELSWNSTLKLLTISGTVFVDGSVTFGSSMRVLGEGTLYANGSITLGNHVNVCSSVGCDGSAWATGNRLALVASKNVTLSNGNVLEAAVYAGGTFLAKNGGTILGPIVAENIEFNNNTIIKNTDFGPPLAGMPGGTTSALTLRNVPGSTRMS